MTHRRDREADTPPSCLCARAVVGASFVVALLLLGNRAALGQHLRLSATVGKDVFFEGEPIYGLFELRNDGPDTAWVGTFGLGPDRLRISLRQLDGTFLPETRMWTEYATPPGWPGVPIAPGERKYQALILQNVLGKPIEPSWTVFPKHIRPGTYTLLATFNAAIDGGRGGVSDLTASPLTIEVRARTPQEERSADEIERICAQAWNRTTRSRYFTSLLSLIEARLAGDSSDAFLAFLINDAVMTGRAVGLTLGARDITRLTTARLGVARAQKAIPSGAMAALTLFADAPPATNVSSLLGGSLAADVVREREKARLGRPIRPGPRQ